MLELVQDNDDNDGLMDGGGGDTKSSRCACLDAQILKLSLKPAPVRVRAAKSDPTCNKLLVLSSREYNYSIIIRIFLS